MIYSDIIHIFVEKLFIMSFKPSKYQEAIFKFINEETGNAVINAVAGSGKTTTLIESLKLVDPNLSILFLAFNKNIKQEIEKRIKAANLSVDINTCHGFGYSTILRNTDKEIVLDNNKYFKLLKDLIKYGQSDDIEAIKHYNFTEDDMQYTLGFNLEFQNKKEIIEFQKNVTNLTNLLRLYVSKEPADIEMIIDKYDIVLSDKEIELAIQLLTLGQKLNNIIDYTDMLYLPLFYDYDAPQYDLVMLDEIQDLNTAQKLLMLKAIKPNGRFIGVGDKNQCQPPETMVRLSNGNEVRIDELKIGDNVISYNTKQGKGFVGYYQSDSFVKRYADKSAKILDIAKHKFNGDLIQIITDKDNYSSKYTPNHKCLIKYKNVNKYLLYLIEKDGKFRIGIMPIQSRHGFGLSVRSRQEKANKSWILKTFDDRDEAYYNEQYYSYEYGIPQLRFIDNQTGTMRQCDIDSIWDRFDTNKMLNNANTLLNLFGRLYEYPFWYQNSNIHNSRTGICEMKACNLIPEIMLVPCFNSNNRGANGNIKAEFQEFNLIREQYEGLVYSLKVSREECYVADNILTHNSIYGFAGSDDESFDKITEIPNTTILSLSEKYRCGHNIVETVKHIVPQIVSHKNNVQGVVNKTDSVNNIAYGDMVLCRNTYPLVKLCLKFITENKKANVMGADIGKTLIKLIESTNETKTVNAIAKLYADLQTVLTRIMRTYNISPENAMRKGEYTNALERIKVFEIIYNDLSEDKRELVENITAKLAQIFKDERDGILLSTIHRAKGLESDKVFIIHAELMPSPYAKKMWELKQEDNLIYVARTRAIQQLSYVTDFDAYETMGCESVDISHIVIKESQHVGSIGQRMVLEGEVIEVKHIESYNEDIFVVQDKEGNIFEHWGRIPQHFVTEKNLRIKIGTNIKGNIKITKHTSFNDVNKNAFKCYK